MAGGLLNLVSHGQENLLLYGNPKKTFFKAVYKTITNFGMQRFRVDYTGSRELSLTEEKVMDFKIPRNADLLGDTYVVVSIPDVWSALVLDPSGDYTETGFKWIDELGSNMIKTITIHAGGAILASYTGEFLSAGVQRDYCYAKRDLWNRMTGNVVELNDPANAFNREGMYPNAYYQGTTNIEPSIRGRKLYIPLDAWFGRMSKMAFPLISLQYNELHISITFRPIKELYRIRDITDISNNYPYVAPNLTESTQQLYRYLNPPHDTSGNGMYPSRQYHWDADIHLMANYYFLSEEERIVFAKNEQKYLIREVYPLRFLNQTGSKVINLESRGLVSSYTFRFRRSDAFMRNEWSNYTNWPYNYLPYNITSTGSPAPPLFLITGNYETANIKNILLDLAIVLDGKYREDLLESGVYNYVEKYIRTEGGAKDGLYSYNFCLTTDPFEYQPTGAMNLNKFENVDFMFNTLQPPANPNPPVDDICDGEGNIIGTRKNLWSLNEYNYDLEIFEERYNVVVFTSGMCGLMFAR